jgi:hypothetical protein
MSTTDDDADGFGDVEARVRADIEALGDLDGVQPSLARVAYTLARALDSGTKGMATAAISRELRETLAALTDSSDADEQMKRLLEQLSTPVNETGQ